MAALLDADFHNLVPHAEHYHKDGDLVVAAGPLPNSTAFRVHMHVLQEHSGVFKDHLAHVPPEEGLVKFDNCPVMTVVDHANDMAILLSALYKGPIFFEDDKKLPVLTALALVDLAAKYQMPTITQLAMPHLQFRFPTTFNGWWGEDSEFEPLEAALSAVVLARKLGFPAILPAALYDVCQLPVKIILHGYHREDGRIDKLSDEDIERVFEGKEKLMKLNAQTNMWVLDIKKPSTSCKTRNICLPVMKRAAHLFVETGQMCAYRPFHWVDLNEGGYENICRPCWRMLCRKRWEGINGHWCELPALMGVEAEVEGWPQE